MAKDKSKSKIKEGESATFEPSAADMAVLQDFQLVINHCNEAMGRFLGHIGVEKHGLTEGQGYQFNPNWQNGTIDVTAVATPPAPKPKVELEK